MDPYQRLFLAVPFNYSSGSPRASHSSNFAKPKDAPERLPAAGLVEEQVPGIRRRPAASRGAM